MSSPQQPQKVGYYSFTPTQSTGTIEVLDYANMLGTTGIVATGTITVINYLALGDAVCTVNSVAYVEGVDWDVATSNEATATSLATAIGAGDCSAVNAGTAIITIEAPDAGVAGNSIALATSDAVNLTISGDYLAGGINAYESITATGTVLLLSNAFPTSFSGITLSRASVWTNVSWTKGATIAESAINLCAALNNVWNVDASVDSVNSSKINLIASSAGIAGNSIEFTTTDPMHFQISGSGTLIGGRIVFPSGCFVDIDAHVTPSCTLVYERI